ncbi:MAG TPA: hypothetical protein VHW23_19935 [Kofleriaceae bacterium]|jgi:hypothetical protein|nr:hypothetical protein [Kofleriaceae bacterium]
MTDPRERPTLLDSAGRIRIEAVNLLSMAEMSSWLAKVLLGDIPTIGADRDESSVDLLVRTYHRLDPWVRHTLHDVLLGLLTDLARGLDRDGARWTVVAAENLLLVVASVVRGTPSVQAAVDLLRCIVTAAPGGAHDDTVPVFALKCLVALDHRAPPEFWLSQFERRGVPSAGPVLRGMVRWDLDIGFRWIADHAGDAAIGAALRASLPLLVDRFGPAAIMGHLAQLAPRLTGEGRAALAATSRALRLSELPEPVTAARAGVDVAGNRSELAQDPAVPWIRYLADPHLLHEARLSDASDPAELRTRLAASLRTIDLAVDRPRHVRALLVLAHLLLDPVELRGAVERLRAWCAGDAELSSAKREALVAMFEELDRGPATPLSFEFHACAYLLRNKRRNVAAEFERLAAGLEPGVET